MGPLGRLTAPRPIGFDSSPWVKLVAVILVPEKRAKQEPPAGPRVIPGVARLDPAYQPNCFPAACAEPKPAESVESARACSPAVMAVPDCFQK